MSEHITIEEDYQENRKHWEHANARVKPEDIEEFKKFLGSRRFFAEHHEGRDQYDLDDYDACNALAYDTDNACGYLEIVAGNQSGTPEVLFRVPLGTWELDTRSLPLAEVHLFNFLKYEA